MKSIFYVFVIICVLTYTGTIEQNSLEEVASAVQGVVNLAIETTEPLLKTIINKLNS